MGLRVNWMGQREESEKLNNRENVGGRGTVFSATNDLTFVSPRSWKKRGEKQD